MDLHEWPVPQRGESGDGCQLPGAWIENRPRPDVAESVAGDRIREEREFGAKAVEGRLAVAAIERSNDRVTAAQAFFRGLGAQACRGQHKDCRNETGRETRHDRFSRLSSLRLA